MTRGHAETRPATSARQHGNPGVRLNPEAGRVLVTPPAGEQ